MRYVTRVDVSDEGGARFTPGKDEVLDGDQRTPGSVSAHADRSPSNDSTQGRRPGAGSPERREHGRHEHGGNEHRRREHRRLAVAVFATALAVPLLLVEVAGGVDASPDSQPAAYVAQANGESSTGEGTGPGDDGREAPRGVGVVTPDELAEARTLGVFGRGEQLRAEAAAEEAEAAEVARAAEEEQLRLREEREAAAEAARRAEQDRRAREQAAEAAAAHAAAEEAARTNAAPANPSGGPSAAQWAALRHCESGGNYQIVSRNGLYHGAYQFYQGTWDNTARGAGRADLVGMRPSAASPADQDALALALYNSRGDRPWPHCGAHLR